MNEKRPSLSVYRPIIGYDDDSLTRLATELRIRHFSPQRLKLFQAKTQVGIMAAGEVRNFLEKFDIEATRDDIEGLADHLEDHMPPSSDKTLLVPSQPFAIRNRLNQSNSRLITLGTDNSVVRFERREAQMLIEDYFDIGEADTSDCWPDGYEYTTELWLARSSHDDSIHRLTKLLQKKPELLPVSLEYGPAIIEIDE
ncbi:MAG: hypothetical protein JWN38_894 [Candidatus Saccharibacteria bacterium]|nr:hypothetical protein [Candidatus Saccharibacteria bacterium]